MTTAIFLLLFPAVALGPEPDLPPTEPFEAPKYGLATRITQGLADRGARRGGSDLRGDHPAAGIRAAGRGGLRAGAGAGKPGGLSHPHRHELPRRTAVPSGKLASNRVIKDGRGERLETIWEFHPDAGGFWREVSVRLIANRQLYTFILNVEDSVVRPGSSGVRCLDRRHDIHSSQYGGGPAGKGVEPLDSARVQVCARPARGLGAGARSQRGGAPVRQRSAARGLVRQSPGAGPSSSPGRPPGTGQATPGPAPPRGPQL